VLSSVTVIVVERTGETLEGETDSPLYFVDRIATDCDESVTELTETVAVYGVELSSVLVAKPATVHSTWLDELDVTSHTVPSLKAIYVFVVIVSKPVPVKVKTSPPS
jgi:hypothetical protein